MGYTTDFEGEFMLDRPLNAEHQDYLQMFSETRRKVLKLRAEGRLITEVAALAGCSPRHVLRILRCNKQGGGR
jgi:hypothetical protein